MSRIDTLLSDLVAEQEALDEEVAHLTPEQWRTPTPAEGWEVRDQISHLAYFDATACLALVAPQRFEEHKRALFAGEEPREADVALGRSVAGDRLLADWRVGRTDLAEAASGAPEGRRVPWYGPEMSLSSFVTARLMEAWAHGQDVRDALGRPPSVSDRLRHVCHIGVAARRYSYIVNGVEPDDTPVRVEAVAPDGVVWAFGDGAAADRITGSALGLALVFTQRRHPDDTDVEAEGESAKRWLSIAQAFAGPAGTGRQPGLGFPAPAAPKGD